MKIQWNSVTWYSKLLALVIFIALPFIGFYLGMCYQKSLSPSSSNYVSTYTKTATNSATLLLKQIIKLVRGA